MSSTYKETRLVWFCLSEIEPSPENDTIYKPVDPQDPEVQKLAQSINEHGILEPLVITEDRFILSGHRRAYAAFQAGCEDVPCRVVPIRREDDIDEFVRQLIEHNRQRVKSYDQQLKEAIATTNPEDAYRSLISFREKKAAVNCETLDIGEGKKRSKISEAKQPMLDAINKILEGLRRYLPVSERQIHYSLLNDPPRLHASRKGLYQNNKNCSQNLSNLLTRARIEGSIPMEWIKDETRPVVLWEAWDSTRPFCDEQLGTLFDGYSRNLQQSQPNHIEIVGEKNTLGSSLQRIAVKYCIPYTLSRGYISLPPRHGIYKRFKESGKEKLVLFLLSDLDPDGMDIAASLVRSLRDDFQIPTRQLAPIRVALTPEQVREHNLISHQKAKTTAKGYDRFVRKFGETTYEIEALPPSLLEKSLQDAIDAVLDQDAFNHELAREKEDAAHVAAVRDSILEFLNDEDFDFEELA